VSISLRVNAAGGFGYLADLEKAIPGAMRQIVRGETGSILKECVLRTKVAKKQAVELRSYSEASRITRRAFFGGSGKRVPVGTMYINNGRYKGGAGQGRTWYRVGEQTFILIFGDGMTDPSRSDISLGKKVYVESRKMRAYMKRQIKYRQKEGLRAIGLSRQSWVQIADSVGIPLETVKGGRSAAAAVRKARRAMASNGQSYLNGSASELRTGFAFAIRLKNIYPLAEKIGMDSVLEGVVMGRIQYFNTNAAHGMLASAKRIAAKYPNIIVTVPSPAIA
jgi:hypothetical protein